MGLSREEILAAPDTIIEEVPVPEWKGSVFVRNLNGTGLDLFQGSRVRVKDNNKVELIHENTRAKLLSLTMCDSAGKLLFSEEDVDALGAKSSLVLDRIFDVAQRLNGLRPQDLEQKIKNSVAVPTVNSSSVLH